MLAWQIDVLIFNNEAVFVSFKGTHMLPIANVRNSAMSCYKLMLFIKHLPDEILRQFVKVRFKGAVECVCLVCEMPFTYRALFGNQRLATVDAGI